MRALPLPSLTILPLLLLTQPLATNAQAKAAPQRNQLSISVPASDISHQSDSETALMSLPEAVTDPSKVLGHTNYLIVESAVGPATATPEGETPDSLRTVYGVPPNRGSHAIAIVDAYHYRTAEADLLAFSTQFHLRSLANCESSGADPNACLKIIYQGGTQPAEDCDWAGETALDLQWAHAMAPNAKLILVEARSAYLDDMFVAVDLAIQELGKSGGGELSLSWGSRETAAQIALDANLKRAESSNVVTFASSGDVGGVPLFPSTSPYSVAVGGTSIVRKNGNFDSETGWSGSGGGSSDFEPQPSYQNSVENTVPGRRSTPDVSAVADPYTGASVYDSAQCGNRKGWIVIGGTSLAAPLVAGMVNAAGHFNVSTSQELTYLYLNRRDPQRIRDIILGGPAGRNKVGIGYDLVTGIGSALGTDFDVPQSVPITR